MLDLLRTKDLLSVLSFLAPSAPSRAGVGPWARYWAMARNRNGAVTSAVLVHLRVEPAHFDWRWRVRPALARLAWEALAHDPMERLRRIPAESIGTTIILGQRLSPIATFQHRPC